MGRVVYNIENRHHLYMYHWFIYMLGGLNFINDNSDKIYINFDNGTPGHSYTWGNGSLTEFLGFHKESLDLIKHKFEVVDGFNSDDTIIRHHGSPNWSVGYLKDYKNGNLRSVYRFLKELMLVEINDSDVKKYGGKKFYISRNKSHKLAGNNGIKRRQILNSDELETKLEERGFDTIYLEDYDVVEKIKLFTLSDTIISPNSAGLLFSIFSKPTTKIVEINVGQMNFAPVMINGYRDICETFGVEYHFFESDKVDEFDNSNVDINKFIIDMCDLGVLDGNL